MLQIGHKFVKTIPPIEQLTEIQLIGIDCEMVLFFFFRYVIEFDFNLFDRALQ